MRPKAIFLGILLGGSLGAAPASAQQPAPCSGSAPDSAWTRDGPVYRDCEVEKPARLRGSPPAIPADVLMDGARTDKPCLAFVLEYVVDTAGAVEPGTIRVLVSEHPEVGAAVRESLLKLRYNPASIGGLAVRQLVLHERRLATSFSFKVSRLGSANMEPPPTLRRC